MSNYNQRRSSQLGVEWSKANTRLRKMILFNLLQRHDEDNCFRCSERIETIEQLSIEHKKPWFGVDSALYWDLDNIAFSHLKCNRPHRNRNGTTVGQS